MIKQWWRVLAEEIEREYSDWSAAAAPIANTHLMCRNDSCFVLDSPLHPARIENPVARNFREADWIIRYLYKHLSPKFSSMRFSDYGLLGCNEEIARHGLAIWFEEDEVNASLLVSELRNLPCSQYEHGGYLGDLQQHWGPIERDAWGWWQYVPCTIGNKKLPDLYHAVKGYSIYLSEVTTPQDILGWMMQIAGKNTAVYGQTCVSDLARAFRAIFGEPETMPSEFDNQKVFVKFEKSLKPIRAQLSKRDRHLVLERDSFTCCDCGRSPQKHGVSLEVDHRIPLAAGGGNELTNLRTLCEDCNRGKSARVIDYPEDHA